MPATPIHQPRPSIPFSDLNDQLPRALADFVTLAGGSDCAVLLGGETGTGKTHLARLIHEHGTRRGKPFVRVNCGAIPESLFERELFGHVRGAFTDARDPGAGFLEAAHGGTLFLDEIGELSLQTQPKLLAVLEDGVFRKLGSPMERRVDVRVVAATHRDLAAMARAGQFRSDLLYRFSVLRFAVAPLRERRHELPGLVRSLLRRIVPPGAPLPEITHGAMEVIRAHSWPGNIRELENALRAATLFSRGGAVLPEHIPPEIRSALPASRSQGESVRYAAPTDPAAERELIVAALQAAGGNKTHAAERLGMSRSTLWAKLQRHGVFLALHLAASAPCPAAADECSARFPMGRAPAAERAATA